MKKLFVLTLLGLFTCGAMFSQPKNNDKNSWKMAKKKAKELASDGWKIDGSRTLEEMMYLHYQKLRNEENQELIANVVGNTSVKTLNQAQQWAAINAATSYAKQAKLEVLGHINNEVGAGIEGAPSVDNFYEGYESKVATEINGQLKKSIALYREKPRGGIDYKIFYLVNEEDASKARLRAMELAMKESEFARNNAERISKFVREGFTVETEQ